MSDGGKTQRPTPAPATKGTASAEVLPSAYRRVDPARGRFDGIRSERAAAAAQIERTMKVWRAGSGAAGNASVPEGGGSPLPSAVRSRMEPKLGASLGDVRVHTGGDSARAAKGFGARAFTVGDDVHFNAGEFQPGTKEGDKLLAHELTHVVQGQKSGVQRKADEKNEQEVSDPEEPAEKEADAASDKVADELHGEEKEEKSEKREKDEEGKKEEKVAAKLEGVGRKVFRAEAGQAPAAADELKSPEGKPAREAQVAMDAPPTLQLYGYGGVRNVNGVKVKEMEKLLEDVAKKEQAREPVSPEERTQKAEYQRIVDGIKRDKDQDYLIFAGHVGVSLDGGATIYGFTPVGPAGMPKEQVIAHLHAHTMTFPGAVKDDKPHFDFATLCNATKGYDTDVVTATRQVSTATAVETKKKLESLAGMAPGAHGLYYAFPVEGAPPGKYFKDAPGPDGKIIEGVNQDNCATFPGRIGVELPDNSGQIRYFMPKLRTEAAGGQGGAPPAPPG